MSNTNLGQTKGDTKKYDLTFKDSNGDAIDITGATVYLSVKDEQNSSVNLFQVVTTTHTSPTTGQTEIEVEPADTASLELGNYWYDIQITTSSSEKYTVLKGNYAITYEITTD